MVQERFQDADGNPNVAFDAAIGIALTRRRVIFRCVALLVNSAHYSIFSSFITSILCKYAGNEEFVSPCKTFYWYIAFLRPCRKSSSKSIIFMIGSKL
jgi:hypothetical protein